MVSDGQTVHFWPHSVYIIGKLCIRRFWNSGGKLFFYHLWSARIFVMHPDWIATFIWFLVLRNPNRPLDHIKNMLVFFPLLLSLIHHFSLPVQRNIERNAHVSTAHCSLNFTRLGSSQRYPYSLRVHLCVILATFSSNWILAMNSANIQTNLAGKD